MDRTTAINNGSKGRKQVGFDLDPLTLRSTITNGGNYNVSVGPMPLTSKAYQLSENLKKLPAIGKQFAEIQQGIGEERAGLIQGADAEEELKRLKEEEPETFFNFMRRKAYTDSLIEKHVRTQMVPNTLHGLTKSADARVFQNENDFNANIDEQLSSSWQEFEQSVGEDVANSVTGRAIWNNLADEMRVEAQASYFESQDAVALENNLESIEHRISSQLSTVDADGNARDIDQNFVSKITKTAIPELMEKHGMSRKDASNHLRTIMATRLEEARIEGKNLLVLDLAEAMERTVSKDGVPIYEGDSATSLSIAKSVAAARNEIEKEEEKSDEISAQEQNIFKGQYTYATGKLANGVRFADLTPQGKQLVLAPLQNADPTFTMEMLEEAMASQGDGDAGGGLTEFENLIQGISINGSDYGRNIILQTKNSRNQSLLTASQLKGPPTAIRDSKLREEWEKAYRNQATNDPDLTLIRFLKEHNIQSWESLDTLAFGLKDVSELVKSTHYTEIGSRLKGQAEGFYSTMEQNETLGLVTGKAMQAMVEDMAKRVQATMVDELISGDLTVDKFKKRSEELQLISERNLKLIMSNTEGFNFDLQTTDIPDASLSTAEMTRKLFNDYEQKPSFQDRYYETDNTYPTNASKTGEIKVKRDTKAFGFISLYDTKVRPWTAEEIAGERADMLQRIETGNNSQQYIGALSYSLYSHGADLMGDTDNVLNMLEQTQMDAMDVALFDDPAQVPMFTESVMGVFDKLQDTETLTEEDMVTLETAKALGLILVDDIKAQDFGIRIDNFETIQKQLTRRNGR